MGQVSRPEHRLTPAPERPVRIGIAGWSYPDWDGVVYPRGREGDRLSFIARFVDAIEINSPFYRIPTPRAAESWVRRARVNPRLKFTVKLYQRFTHERRAEADDERAFREALAPLVDAGILGAVLLQFPWSFKNEPDGFRCVADLLERFESYPLVVEVRHGSWNVPELFRLLQERRAGFCNIDQPVIGRSIEPSARATGPVGYVRLHGRNYRTWFRKDAGRDDRYDYLYTEGELDPWLQKIEEVRERAAETYVITNNHFRGQAVVNALQIRARMERRRVRAPASLVERYPVLAETVETDPPRQGRLF